MVLINLRNFFLRKTMDVIEETHVLFTYKRKNSNMPNSKVHQDRGDKGNSPKKADSRLMEAEGEKRNGSDSDAHSGRKASRQHENHHDQNTPQDRRNPAEFDQDLTANNRAGENNGVSNPSATTFAPSAYEMKSMHTILADLTDDELKTIQIVPEGSRLHQGAKYIDLQHLEQGEFTATSEMVAETGHAYVPKKETDYVLWNRLNQVSSPERLDEPAS